MKDFHGYGYATEVIYSVAANSEEFFKLAIKKQMVFDFRNEYTDNGFDEEVKRMISTVTLNVGY